MRTLILLGALGAITTCASMPWYSNTMVDEAFTDITSVDINAIPMDLSTLPDNDDTFETEKKKKNKKPKQHGHIPVGLMKCMGHNMTARKDDWLTTKMNFTTWFGPKVNSVEPRGYESQTWPCHNGPGVTWYICNCKYFHADKGPLWELDEVERLLREKCGPWQSGWVWSGKWQKGYNIVPSEWFRPREHDMIYAGKGDRICPPNCL
ncbi:hypothetical protein F5Y09DRAFT_345298 [Xylaria sp. FL1042]|nr:hypothetical protein F5Y09DRAFT_345298 [Xylaria sp. FL1042]